MLNGLGLGFVSHCKSNSCPWNAATFEELYDLPVSHESYFKHLESSTAATIISTSNTYWQGKVSPILS